MFSAQKTANLGWFPRFGLGFGPILAPSQSSAIRCLNVLEEYRIMFICSFQRQKPSPPLNSRDASKRDLLTGFMRPSPSLGHLAGRPGYGAFSVGVSQLADTVAYISDQEEHHRTKSFREEYVGFLRKHGYPDHLLTASFTPALRDGADLKS